MPEKIGDGEIKTKERLGGFLKHYYRDAGRRSAGHRVADRRYAGHRDAA
jgi:hypothetical protein